MIYRKNIYAWEQALRILIGLAIAAAGGFWFSIWPHRLLFYATVVSGVLFALTGLFGFCPACAMMGRKPVDRASQDR